MAIKFTQSLKTPTDFNLLANDIYKVTRQSISTSTLKRIWGYVNSGHGISYSSLSLLSRYIGYSDWDAFYRHIEKMGTSVCPTSGFESNSIIVSSNLHIGTTLLLEWAVMKRCKLKKIKEPDIFQIEQSENIKLKTGDMGKIESIALGQPLILTDCQREGKNLGTYSGAVKEGVAKINFV
ncbi:MAG: hypothetical protein K2M39_06920 [Muribaculaceae bacterium]|nr:hypothetical protein [Muribaculaceae bacterium]